MKVLFLLLMLLNPITNINLPLVAQGNEEHFGLFVPTEIIWENKTYVINGSFSVKKQMIGPKLGSAKTTIGNLDVYSLNGKEPSSAVVMKRNENWFFLYERKIETKP